MIPSDSSTLRRYLETFSSPHDPLLGELERRTHLETVWPQMMSGALQGRLLELISSILRPAQILEIGTFTGYSAICLARGLQEGGKLITLESNDEYENIIREFFGKAGITDRTELIIGDAREIIPRLDTLFDLVFLDADKKEYTAYYDLVIGKVRPGGILLADNVLWDGKVLEAPEKMDEETAAIHRFNRKVTDDPRVENFILPLRDGIMMMRKK